MTLSLKRIGGLLWRVRRGIDKALLHLLLPISTKIHKGEELVRYGTKYGGWTIPINLLSEDSICYCVGVGIDASFDFALIDNIGCKVFSFDPTPTAIEYMQNAHYDRTKLIFSPVGIWCEDKTIRFYSPSNPQHTSHSVYDLHGTGHFFSADCRKISTIMNEFGHEKIDLLKLDIEGSWEKVIQNILQENINISILCLEMDSPVTLKKVLNTIRAIKGAGLNLCHIEKDNYLFIKTSL